MTTVYWRDSQRPIRFFIFDARASIAVFIFLLHMRWWTLLMVVLFMIVFWGLERMGLTFNAATRRLRCFLVGPNRPRLPKLEPTKMKDFG